MSSLPPPANRTAGPGRASLSYIAGLDGLRAIAVVFVLLYHGQDLSGIPSFLEPRAGFLGVEMFFVISGFLITALLMQEHERSGTIALKDFWIRRARRLLPALFLFLAGTTALAALFARDALEEIRSQILGAVLYFINWQLIVQDQSYFEAAGRPSLLRHLWSLAIEEQFYLVWPLVVVGLLKLGGRRVLLAVTAAGVIGATTLMWVLFDGIEQYGDTSGVYLRTDARAGALLLGAALGLAWRPWRNGTMRAGWRWGVDALGAGALVAVVAMQYLFTDRVIEWATIEQLYHGGFLLLSAATAIVIGAVAVPGSRLGKALGNPVFRWIGLRSYGIYLWHWPVYQLTRPRIDVSIDGYTLLATRVGITLVLVEVSYRLIEVPVRERRFVGSILDAVRTPRGIVVASVGALAMIAATGGIAAAIPTIDRTPPTPIEVAVAAPADADDGIEPIAAPAPTPLPEATPEPNAATTPGATPEPNAATTPGAIPEPEPDPPPREIPGDDAIRSRVDAATLVDGAFESNEPPTPVPTPTQPPLPPPPPLDQPFDIGASRIHIVGDSVLEGARGQLYRIAPQVTVDGRTGRQWWELPGELVAMRQQGLGNDVVVIQLGNNGPFTTAMFDGVMNALAGTRLVIFVNIHSPVVWEAEVNAMLASHVNRYPDRARLIDWYTAAEGHPEYFVEDGTHLQGAGMVAMRSLIENSLLSLG